MPYLITGAIATAGAVAIAAYLVHHTIRHGPNSFTPVESWAWARHHKNGLDRELVKMVGHANTTKG